MGSRLRWLTCFLWWLTLVMYVPLGAIQMRSEVIGSDNWRNTLLIGLGILITRLALWPVQARPTLAIAQGGDDDYLSFSDEPPTVSQSLVVLESTRAMVGLPGQRTTEQPAGSSSRHPSPYGGRHFRSDVADVQSPLKQGNLYAPRHHSSVSSRPPEDEDPFAEGQYLPAVHNPPPEWFDDPRYFGNLPVLTPAIVRPCIVSPAIRPLILPGLRSRQLADALVSA